MREMVLNHASVLAPGSDRDTVTYWLVDLTGGIAELIRDRSVQNTLRLARADHEMLCLPGFSWVDATEHLRVQGFRDAHIFLRRLTTKNPLLTGVGAEVRDRFLACEERTLPPPDGEPLVFCAITDGIAVGFPSAPEWDRNRVTVHFDELLPDESTEPSSEEIDQLTRSLHAGPIHERHRDRLRAGSDPVSLWENREEVFPSLEFGPGVRGNLQEYAHLLRTIIGKLAALDKSARDWLDRGGPVPEWGTRVTSESKRVMDDPGLREARKFPSHHGMHKLFEWHARFGRNGRIHLRFDPESREIEIGYIGPHLPLS